jgi:predicted RNA-binding protein with PIN domain
LSIHIIIDGYNLVRRSTTLSLLDDIDIQQGREALIDTLVQYKKLKGHRITVVFDGTNAPLFFQKRDRVKGIEVLFSRSGETADSVIKKIASREKEKVIVVSSDREIVDYVLSKGAASVSSEKFESMISMAAHMDNDLNDEDEYTGWVPTTKKKGPSRRLSKKERKNRGKTKKL